MNLDPGKPQIKLKYYVKPDFFLREMLKQFLRQSEASNSFSSFIFQRFKMPNDLACCLSLFYIQKEVILLVCNPLKLSVNYSFQTKNITPKSFTLQTVQAH